MKILGLILISAILLSGCATVNTEHFEDLCEERGMKYFDYYKPISGYWVSCVSPDGETGLELYVNKRGVVGEEKKVVS